LGGLIAYLTASPFIIIEKLKILPQNFGYTQLPVFAAFTLGSLFVEYKVNDDNIRPILTAGIYIVVTSAVLMIVLSFFGMHLINLVLPMVFYVFGSSLCGSALVSEAMNLAGNMKGSAAAFLGFGMAVACVFSSSILGLFYNGQIISVALLIFGMSFCAFLIFKLYKLQPTVSADQIQLPKEL
jgi:hypothetical protein